MAIAPFTGGKKTVREKLNRMGEDCNVIEGLRGDEEFIAVKKTGQGATVGLLINNVLKRVPRSPRQSFPAEVIAHVSANVYTLQGLDSTLTKITTSSFTACEMNGASGVAVGTRVMVHVTADGKWGFL